MKKHSQHPVVPLALVHHANQYLITDGYADRQGISQIVEGYTRVLLLHMKYRVPLNLHLSGTLIETLAWHCPWFFELVCGMKEQGLLTLIGGTYAENVMTLFEPSFNLHQLNEHLWLYREHLGCSPEDITVCWIPERVWNTALLAGVVTSERLANGGYRCVLLDDRLLYPTYGAYTDSPRDLFDRSGPYDALSAETACPSNGRLASPRVEPCRGYRIANARGLILLPISAHLRYWIPPACEEHWQYLKAIVELPGTEGAEDGLLVYADDLEKAAGVGGWNAQAPERYEAFLAWIASQNYFIPVHLGDWLKSQVPTEQRPIEEGCFFEIARERKAGEDYRGWVENKAWKPYRRMFEAALDALHCTQVAGADAALTELARKHLMACTYETAWHEIVDGKPVPAAWAKALASHTRATHVILAAASWFAQCHRPLSTEIEDIDGDGREEVILRGAKMYAVLSPHQGARLTYLFVHTASGGALVIGNPTDDWNLQQELNSYMQQPPNHPGALADRGYEHDEYRVVTLDAKQGVDMLNVQAGSDLYGARKRLRVLPEGNALAVCYHLPDTVGSLDTLLCCSPDYYRLLREGSAHVRPILEDLRRGFSLDDVSVWAARFDDDTTRWVQPEQPCAGHGLNVQLHLSAPHAHFLIGYDEPDGDAGHHRNHISAMRA